MPWNSNARRSFVLCLLLSAATVGAYWPVNRFAFIDLDDPEYVTLNPYIAHGFGWHGVLWAFQTGRAGNWHPLTWLSHLLDVQLFGLHAGPHHLVSLLFHVGNTLLLFFLCKQMTGALWRSAFVAALFALHPLHVESVAWVSERKEVLSTFFGLLSLWAYASYVRSVGCRVSEEGRKSEIRNPKSETGNANPEVQGSRFRSSISHLPSRIFYLLSLLLFALSLMSKPMWVTLPFLLLLLDYWPLRRVERSALGSLLLEKGPFLLLAALDSVATLVAQSRAGAVASLQDVLIGPRIAGAVMAYFSYLEKTFWPHSLAVFYPYEWHWSLARVLLAGLLLAALSVAALWSARRRPYLIVGWCWFAGTLVPVIGLVQVGAQAMADRYTYVPLIGLFLALVWAASEAVSGWRYAKVLLAAVGSSVVAACAAATVFQLATWENSETLCRHALAVTTDNYVAHATLGSTLLAHGKIPEAKAEFQAALEIAPTYSPPAFGLGRALLKEGKEEEAISVFQQKLQMDPKDAAAHYLLGCVLARQNKVDEAVVHFEAAIQSRPSYLEAHNDLAELLVSNRQAAAALSHGLAALRLDPDSAEAHFNMGGALLLQGRLQEALPHYQAALKARPGWAAAHLNAGKALLNLGKLPEAEEHLRQGLRLEPDNLEIHRYLATVYAAQKRPREQAREYEDMLHLAPDWPEVLNNLAWLRATDPNAELRNGTQAVTLAQRACELSGQTNLWLLSTLAAAYAEAGRFGDAASAQEKVCRLAASQGATGQVESFQQRLDLYRSGQPYRKGGGR